MMIINDVEEIALTARLGGLKVTIHQELVLAKLHQRLITKSEARQIGEAMAARTSNPKEPA